MSIKKIKLKELKLNFELYMTKVINFSHPPKFGTYCNIEMDNGDPCWISISQKGLVIKKSKLGIFGKVIFEKIFYANKKMDGFEMSRLPFFQSLKNKFENSTLKPSDMMYLPLDIIVNAVLHCSSINDIKSMMLELEIKD